MVPMEEKEPQRTHVSALLEDKKPLQSHPTQQQESSSYSSTDKAIANQKYTRGKKPGSDLPANLQRRGREIIHDILLNEVIAALDEIIQMSGDKLNDIILNQ